MNIANITKAIIIDALRNIANEMQKAHEQAFSPEDLMSMALLSNKIVDIIEARAIISSIHRAATRIEE